MKGDLYAAVIQWLEAMSAKAMDMMTKCKAGSEPWKRAYTIRQMAHKTRQNLVEMTEWEKLHGD